MKRHAYLKIKKDVNIEDMLAIHPILLKMIADVSIFCLSYGILPEITSIYRAPDKISKSTTHQTMRAFDLSLKASSGWTIETVNALEKYVEDNYSHVGAISRETGESRPIYIHKNKIIVNNEVLETKGFHAHCQVRPQKE